MAKLSRTLFVLVPFLLTLATLVCLILVFSGNTGKNPIARTFHFLYIDTHDFYAAQNRGAKMSSWYTVGLWNYCRGNKGNPIPSFCSKPTAFFSFDPIAVWKLQGTKAFGLISQDWIKALATYHAACKWLFSAYIAAIAATAGTLFLAGFAFCRRLGSLFTAIVAIAAMVFTIGASATAVAIYTVMNGFIKKDLSPVGLSASLNLPTFATTWLASAFISFAALFWLFTICCCPGGHRDEKRRAAAGEKYERVPSPFVVTGDGHAHKGMDYSYSKGGFRDNTAYEPFSHQRV